MSTRVLDLIPRQKKNITAEPKKINVSRKLIRLALLQYLINIAPRGHKTVLVSAVSESDSGPILVVFLLLLPIRFA